MENRSEPFWMIYGLGQGAPTMIHDTFDAAKAEATRLARNNAGVKFYILQSVGCATKIDVQFREIDGNGGRFFDDNDLPF